MLKRLACIFMALLFFICMPACARTPRPDVSESATPTSAPEPTPEPDPIADYISSMTEEELIGQMIMIGFYGTSGLSSDAKSIIEQYKIGSIMLFGWNCETFSQTDALIDKINACNSSEIPLFIGLDVEGANVRRFVWSPSLRSAWRLGQSGDSKAVFDMYERIGSQLTDIGVNLDFAPVADIAPDYSKTFLGKRMFGSKPDKVAPLVAKAVEGLHSGGTAALVKHFPGHGGTATDSHSSTPVINKSLDELRKYDLIPFSASITAGVDAVLVGHLSFPKIDPEYMASMSEIFMTDILREELGFEGVIFSDDMRMGAVVRNYDIGEASVRFILAGGDVLLVGKGTERQKAVCEAVTAAVQNGTITRERLEQSVYRILIMKSNRAGFEV